MNKAYDTFYDVLKYSNYKVILCYKLVFNSEIFKYNKGFWIIFILFLLYLSQLVIYIIKKISPLKVHIARYHFQLKIQKNTKNKICETYTNRNYDNLSEKIDITPSGPKIQFPPKKMKSSNNDLVIFQSDKYEGRNSDNNVLKFNSKNVSQNIDENKNETKKINFSIKSNL